jgi:PAS domain S-box-containing protein
MRPRTFNEALQSHVARRAQRGLVLFAAMSLLGAGLELFTFEGRTGVLLAVDLLFAVIVVAGLWAVRRRPDRSVEIMVGCVAAAGLGIAIYHGGVGAYAEGCLLVTTALLAATTVFFPWGWRAQLVASSGAIVGFPIALLYMPTGLSPLANLSFLACVVSLSGYAAELNRRQLSRDFYLVQSLRRREARLRSYLDQALIGIGVLDRDGKWIEVNDALVRLLEYSRIELLRRRWTDIADGDAGAEASLEDLCLACKDGGTVDCRLRRRDGHSFYACIGARCFRDDDGAIEEVVLMVLDISSRKRTEAELKMAKDVAEAAYRSKSEFLAHMSHELRTPMNVIFGMTEMALDSDVTSDQREYLQKTRCAARDLLVLVDEVLDLSRIEAGRLYLSEREFPLRQWLAQTIEPLAVLAREKGLDLLWQVDPAVPERAIGDPDRLRQVLANLVGNAIKFTDAGYVRIDVAREESDGRTIPLRFTVEDTGVGVPLEQRSSIFEAFVQGDGRERPSPGTGLGLTICSRLVDLMGGRIWLDSEVGHGSRFRFTAVVADADRASPPAA